MNDHIEVARQGGVWDGVALRLARMIDSLMPEDRCIGAFWLAQGAAVVFGVETVTSEPFRHPPSLN